VDLLLFSRKAGVNIKDNDGDTALTIAIEKDEKEIIKLLKEVTPTF